MTTRILCAFLVAAASISYLTHDKEIPRSSQTEEQLKPTVVRYPFGEATRIGFLRQVNQPPLKASTGHTVHDTMQLELMSGRQRDIGVRAHYFRDGVYIVSYPHARFTDLQRALDTATVENQLQRAPDYRSHIVVQPKVGGGLKFLHGGGQTTTLSDADKELIRGFCGYTASNWREGYLRYKRSIRRAS